MAESTGNGAIKRRMEIKKLIDSQDRTYDAMVYTNESVMRGQRSGLGTTARPRNEVSVEKSDAYQIKTSSMRMEMRLQSRH